MVSLYGRSPMHEPECVRPLPVWPCSKYRRCMLYVRGWEHARDADRRLHRAARTQNPNVIKIILYFIILKKLKLM
jgi:hypothetical protein